MDSTPPSLLSEKIKTILNLNPVGDFDIESEETLNHCQDIVPSSKKTPSSSNLSLVSSSSLKELLLLSPSPYRKSKTRLADRLDAAEELTEIAGSRRKCKPRGAQMASPRNCRRSKRRIELEIREEKDASIEDIVKVKKRRSGRSKKEKMSSVPSVPSTNLSQKIDDGGQGNLDRIGELLTDLIMWNDVAKSSLWFGFGSMCFLSSCFARGINFSIFSAISQLGLLLLGASFILNSISQRNSDEKRSEFKLRDDDILRVAKLILPAMNFAISKIRVLLSGDPSVTLKAVPFLIIGAEYGHLTTLWRLCAAGFFLSFTAPKLYSCYSDQIKQKVKYLRWWILEAWRACSHKKIVAGSAVTAFWNLSTAKTLIITVFVSLVILKYSRQHLVVSKVEGEAEEAEPEHQKTQALVAAEAESQK